MIKKPKCSKTYNCLSIEAKDIAKNLAITLDWVLRLEKDPSQVEQPDDKYEYPQQAVMSITQAITFIQEFRIVSKDVDRVKIDSLSEDLYNCLFWACRVFNDHNMVIAETDSIDWPVETIKILFDMRTFLRDCILYFGHNPYEDDF